MKFPESLTENIFRLGLYPSLISGLGAFGLQLFILIEVTRLSLYHSIIFSLITGILIFTAVYIGMNARYRKRLNTLHTILDNLANKEFRNYNYLDISEQDELDQALRQAIRASNSVAGEFEQMNETENYRQEFIGDISHELKTPIFAIQGFIETLLDGAVEDPNVNRRFLQKTKRHVNRLIYLTQDLMEISQLETGELESHFESIYLKDLIMDVVESLQHRAEQEGIDLNTEQMESDLTVYADRHQIRRVLTNLVDNAIKYNQEEGAVTIGIKPYSQSKKHKRILVYVQDTGIGISPDKIDRITERFYRVDKSRSRQKGGTGLGLSIVKHIMEVHGEELFIESTPGEGSTFSFTLTEVHYPSV